MPTPPSSRVCTLMAQNEQNQQLLVQLAEKEFKIKALTLELAHHKRIRFGKASECSLADSLC
jgi:hypothetical protein